MATTRTAPVTATPSWTQALERPLVQRPVILQLLRFVAIGVINTALDFLILNFLSKTLHINAGARLGTVNVIGFSAATVQSYLWNRYWAFSDERTVNVMKNFWRLVVIGGIGFLTFVAVVVGAKLSEPPYFYLVLLGLFIAAEAGAWFGFGIGRNDQSTDHSQRFVLFLAVSIVGLIINSVLLSLASRPLTVLPLFQANPDLVKNAAKLIATVFSLVWNFIGYKLLVFKR